MAKVIITFEDDDNGGNVVNVSMKFDPDLDMRSDDLGTPAQNMAFRVMHAAEQITDDDEEGGAG
jgi:hypothetical protein